MKTLFFGVMLWAGVTFGGEIDSFSAAPGYEIVAGAEGTLRFFHSDGTQSRTHQVGGLLHDLEVLPSGNILYANGDAVREIEPQTFKTVWAYIPKEKNGGGVYACQRLTNGSTLVGENSTGRVLEIAPDGSVKDSCLLVNFKKGNHHNIRLVRKTASGNWLVCHSGENTVREYDRSGNVVWTLQTPALAFQAERLPNGNTLVSHLNAVTEYSPGQKTVWSFTTADAETPIRNITGFEILPNGNLLIGCYAAYDKGQGSAMFEVGRDRKVRWHYSNPKSGSTFMVVRALNSHSSPKSCPPLNP